MNSPKAPIRVAVLKGGPDPEHEVSLASGAQVAESLRGHRGYEVVECLVDRPTTQDLLDLEADVIFPVLHGPWGEGGPLQKRLEATGIPFVGCGSTAAEAGMNKDETKRICRNARIPTPEWEVLEAGVACDLQPPCVVKPVAEGSSVGVRLCRDQSELTAARIELSATHSNLMAERLIEGRELTIGIVGDRVLPMIEIRTASGFYDYDAKYVRNDTEYLLPPRLPQGVQEDCRRQALKLWHEIGARDVGRIDFLFDGETAWLLEINTMPGFTDHSLVPMAARHDGMDMMTLCGSLVEMARQRLNADQPEGLVHAKP
ncbi:MAG: D-alanine--D-alanine ligase [Planctomycetota bacterium]|nr:D-alanine--D-alanine ligase [Planctomycetota bacterium]